MDRENPSRWTADQKNSVSWNSQWNRKCDVQFGKLAIQSTVSTLGTIAIAAQAMTNILENLNGIAPSASESA